MKEQEIKEYLQSCLRIRMQRTLFLEGAEEWFTWVGICVNHVTTIRKHAVPCTVMQRFTYSVVEC